MMGFGSGRFARQNSASLAEMHQFDKTVTLQYRAVQPKYGHGICITMSENQT